MPTGILLHASYTSGKKKPHRKSDCRWRRGADSGLSADYNATVLVLDPYTGTTRLIEFPGISNQNDKYHATGVEYDAVSHSMFITVNAPLPWYTLGADLSGPNYLIRYDLAINAVLWQADLAPIQDELLSVTGLRGSGLGDSAVNGLDGANYMSISYGNSIAKVDSEGKVSIYYYTPKESINTTDYGYLGLVIPIGSGKLVVADAVSHAFVAFNLCQNLTTGVPKTITLTNPEALPAGYTLDCDGLIAPKVYNNTVLLCSTNFFRTAGVLTIFRSTDNFETIRYVGLVDNQEAAGNLSLGAVPVTSVEVPGSIYILQQYFFDGGDPSKVGNRTRFPLVDVTSRVTNIVNSDVALDSSKTSQASEAKGSSSGNGVKDEL